MHIPVLQKEVLQYLEPKPNENFVDCTIGSGGHALAILEKTSPEGKILGIDADEKIIKNLKTQSRLFGKRITFVCDNYVNLQEIVKKYKFRSIHGILLDLGMSSWDLEESGRGFSFLKKEPLDMRYDPQNPLTAEKIINYWSAPEIERILGDYGEESFARVIAKNIIEFRKIKPITNTFQLVEIIKNSFPKRFQQKKIHPATKTFQALRIAVNDELNNLEKVLPQALEVLKPGGKLVIISFHSLEDRIVKNFYRSRLPIPRKWGETEFAELRSPHALRFAQADEAKLQRSSIDLKILTKKPIGPTGEEIKINPRSRSAKLRAAEKLPTTL
ncbi:MAG TPA: 16S rRNA (cytosine(1402)-N(4))-methyltransferase RsmH [Candidatus Humimicrobiaceae bacterium]|nr:16S rRNA (cytosine(1402)-N(4))-methyltransferase RsmH [Candidatus Humimicrobiaceae bacterium]